MTRIFKAKQMEECISNDERENNLSLIEGKSLSIKNEITRLHQGKNMEMELNELIWDIWNRGFMKMSFIIEKEELLPLLNSRDIRICDCRFQLGSPDAGYNDYKKRPYFRRCLFRS
ncbi:hypothetical protein RCO48_25105 [Peribacillus frigoritolerans]|nr:hypothetical protein [Peribacillus frigoritolerans]